MTYKKAVRRDDEMDGRQLEMRGHKREFCLLKGIAEGTYNSKHAEAARLYYVTVIQRQYHNLTHDCTHADFDRSPCSTACR